MTSASASSARSLPVPTLVLVALEHALNQALSLDVSGAPALDVLHGKTIAVQLRAPSITFYARVHARNLRLQSAAPAQVHASISGTPWSLARLTWSGDRAGVLQGEVTLAGDMEVARALQKLLAQADIDLEELLARYTGDVVAHQLGNMARGLLRWGRESARRLQLDFGEYLTEEARLLPARVELDMFLNEVDALRSDVDRLQQRIQRLQQRSPS